MTKHLARGLTFQGAFTWSRSTDTTEGTRFNDDCGGPAQANFGHNPFNLALDYAPSCFDISKSAHMNVIYHLPGLHSEGFLSKVTNGWWIGNIVSIQGGNPFVPIVNNDRSYSGIVSQNSSSVASINTTSAPLNFVNPFDPKKVITGDPNHWFDISMFGVPQLGNLGNAPRGLLRNPGMGEWDFSLVKDTKLGLLGEEGNVQFRAEFFNLLNRANFGFVNTGMVAFNGTNNLNASNIKIACPEVGATFCADPGVVTHTGNYGQITQTATTARQIQLALRVSF